MNRLPRKQQEAVIHLLLEGCSLRSATRLTGVHRDTIARLMVQVGKHCDRLTEELIRNFQPSVLEVDEAWTYVGKKDKRIQVNEDPSAIGSQWIFVAMCRDSKLIPAFALGKRTTEVANRLMNRLSSRIACRPRIVTDALEAYQEAVEKSFGSEVDYTKMTKEFGDGTSWIKPVHVQGRIPKPQVSTSLIERQNLTLRNFVRRLNRKDTLLLEEAREPKGCSVDTLFLVQLREDPRNAQMYPSDGGWAGIFSVGGGSTSADFKLGHYQISE